MLSTNKMGAIIYERWFLSQVGKAIDCNSMIAGSSPTGTSKTILVKKIKKVLKYCLPFDIIFRHLSTECSTTWQCIWFGTRGLQVQILSFRPCLWGHSSAGRAPALHAGGQGFDPPWLHQFF